jgi:hypothetical protein
MPQRSVELRALRALRTKLAILAEFVGLRNGGLLQLIQRVVALAMMHFY